MDDKQIVDAIKEKVKELNSLVIKASTENRLTITFDIRDNEYIAHNYNDVRLMINATQINVKAMKEL